MDVILVSGRRAPDEPPHPSRERAVALSRALVDAGHVVRWLCPVAGPDDLVEPPDGVGLHTIETRPPPFADVQNRVADPFTECELGLMMRARLPDAVHQLSLGGQSSLLLSWIIERLGSSCVVDVELDELLCHRGTLIDEQDQPCSTWDQPDRCVECTTSPWQFGLTEREARRARGWPWRWRRLAAWSPYPKPFDFINRLDMAVGACLSARAVVVGEPAAVEPLRALGVPSEAIEVRARAARDAAWATALYERVQPM